MQVADRIKIIAIETFQICSVCHNRAPVRFRPEMPRITGQMVRLEPYCTIRAATTVAGQLLPCT